MRQHKKNKKKQQHNLKVEYGIVTRDQNKTNAPNFANLLLDSNSSIVIIIVFVVVNSFPSLAQLKCGPLFLSHHQKLLKLLHSMLYNTVKHAHRRTPTHAESLVAFSRFAIECETSIHRAQFMHVCKRTEPQKVAMDTCVYLLRASMNFCRNEFTSIVCIFSMLILVLTPSDIESRPF